MKDKPSYKIPEDVLASMKVQSDSIEHAQRGHTIASAAFYEFISRRQQDLWQTIRQQAGVPAGEKTIKIDWGSGEVTIVPQFRRKTHQ